MSSMIGINASLVSLSSAARTAAAAGVRRGPALHAGPGALPAATMASDLDAFNRGAHRTSVHWLRERFSWGVIGGGGPVTDSRKTRVLADRIGARASAPARGPGGTLFPPDGRSSTSPGPGCDTARDGRSRR